MEKGTKDRKKQVIPAAKSFSTQDATGWMFKLVHEGWLRKRWRKRYCVLSNGILYTYELETASGSEKTSSSINLTLFEDCIRASRKECKKSPNTFILVPKNVKINSTDSILQVTREFFYTEMPDELQMWMEKLKESISMCNAGLSSSLKHVTKSRARPPGGSRGRRPPTKHHLKERATMSENGNDQTTQEKGRRNVKHGHVPSVALKPKARSDFPVSSSTPLMPSSEKAQNPEGINQVKDNHKGNTAHENIDFKGQENEQPKSVTGNTASFEFLVTAVLHKSASLGQIELERQQWVGKIPRSKSTTCIDDKCERKGFGDPFAMISERCAGKKVNIPPRQEPSSLVSEATD